MGLPQAACDPRGPLPWQTAVRGREGTRLQLGSWFCHLRGAWEQPAGSSCMNGDSAQSLKGELGKRAWSPGAAHVDDSYSPRG